MTFVAGTVLTAAALNSELAAKSDLAMTQNAQTGSSYSYALADASKLLTMSNAASNTVTVTKQATVTWVTGTQLRVLNLGAGVTTLVADTGVTINNNTALAQYQGGTLIRTASDVWAFVPNAVASTTLITSASLSGASVSFTSIPSTYRNLRLYILNGRSSSNAEIRLTWTGSTNFRTVQARYVPGIATDVRGLNDGFGYLTGGGVSAAGTGLQAVANIFEANNSSSRKIMHVDSGGEWESVGSAMNSVSFCTDATAAIATLTLSPSAGNFNQGTAYLYGSN